MSYLEPPPAPNPVVVVKDVGGLVTDYQARTELYRRTNREVQLHECRSACTMALSLPNVCVFPDSTLKFHQAYNWDTKVRDLGVSAQLFATYPAAVRARLGTLTRDYRILTGRELIALGVRDCTVPHPAEPRIMVASTTPQPLPATGSLRDLSVSGLVHGVMSAFDRPTLRATPPTPAAALAPPPPSAGPSAPVPVAQILPADAGPAPLPPPRPLDLEPTASIVVAGVDVPLPPRRPTSLRLAYTKRLPVIALPRIITGAQPILPTDFSAYAALR